MAIDFRKYIKNQKQLELIEEIYNYLSEDLLSLTLKCGDYSFHVDPYGFGSATVWINEEQIADFATIDDFFLKFIIGGKPLIERIDELEYDF